MGSSPSKSIDPYFHGHTVEILPVYPPTPPKKQPSTSSLSPVVPPSASPVTAKKNIALRDFRSAKRITFDSKSNELGVSTFIPPIPIHHRRSPLAADDDAFCHNNNNDDDDDDNNLDQDALSGSISFASSPFQTFKVFPSGVNNSTADSSSLPLSSSCSSSAATTSVTFIPLCLIEDAIIKNKPHSVMIPQDFMLRNISLFSSAVEEPNNCNSNESSSGAETKMTSEKYCRLVVATAANKENHHVLDETQSKGSVVGDHRREELMFVALDEQNQKLLLVPQSKIASLPSSTISAEPTTSSSLANQTKKHSPSSYIIDFFVRIVPYPILSCPLPAALVENVTRTRNGVEAIAENAATKDDDENDKNDAAEGEDFFDQKNPDLHRSRRRRESSSGGRRKSIQQFNEKILSASASDVTSPLVIACTRGSNDEECDHHHRFSWQPAPAPAPSSSSSQIVASSSAVVPNNNNISCCSFFSLSASSSSSAVFQLVTFSHPDFRVDQLGANTNPGSTPVKIRPLCPLRSATVNSTFRDFNIYVKSPPKNVLILDANDDDDEQKTTVSTDKFKKSVRRRRNKSERRPAVVSIHTTCPAVLASTTSATTFQYECDTTTSIGNQGIFALTIPSESDLVQKLLSDHEARKQKQQQQQQDDDVNLNRKQSQGALLAASESASTFSCPIVLAPFQLGDSLQNFQLVASNDFAGYFYLVFDYQRRLPHHFHHHDGDFGKKTKHEEHEHGDEHHHADDDDVDDDDSCFFSEPLVLDLDVSDQESKKNTSSRIIEHAIKVVQEHHECAASSRAPSPTKWNRQPGGDGKDSEAVALCLRKFSEARFQTQLWCFAVRGGNVTSATTCFE